MWRYGHASAAGEFVVLPKDAKGKLKAGVYKRGHISKSGKFSASRKSRSSNIKMLASFEDKVKYGKKQMPFDRIVIKNFRKEFKMRLHRNYLRIIKQEVARRK